MYLSRKYQHGRYYTPKPVRKPVLIDWTPVVIVLVVCALIALIAYAI